MRLLGFGAALRRSELVGRTIGDVECTPARAPEMAPSAPPGRPRQANAHSGGAGFPRNRAARAKLRQPCHRSPQPVFGYINPADLWRNNLTEGLFGAGG